MGMLRLMLCIRAVALMGTTVCHHQARPLGPTAQVPSALLPQAQMALLALLKPLLMVSNATLFSALLSSVCLNLDQHTFCLVWIWLDASDEVCTELQAAYSFCFSSYGSFKCNCTTEPPSESELCHTCSQHCCLLHALNCTEPSSDDITNTCYDDEQCCTCLSIAV